MVLTKICALVHLWFISCLNTNLTRLFFLYFCSAAFVFLFCLWLRIKQSENNSPLCILNLEPLSLKQRNNLHWYGSTVKWNAIEAWLTGHVTHLGCSSIWSTGQHSASYSGVGLSLDFRLAEPWEAPYCTPRRDAKVSSRPQWRKEVKPQQQNKTTHLFCFSTSFRLFYHVRKITSMLLRTSKFDLTLQVPDLLFYNEQIAFC